MNSPVSALPISGSDQLAQSGELVVFALVLNRTMTFSLQVAY